MSILILMMTGMSIHIRKLHNLKRYFINYSTLQLIKKLFNNEANTIYIVYINYGGEL
jgi:hypothetical protein